MNKNIQPEVQRKKNSHVCWQDPPPPGGELTAQAEGDACHKVAPRASIPSLSVRPPSPLLTTSLGPRCYNLLLKRDRLCVYAVHIRVSFSGCRLNRDGAPQAKTGPSVNS